MLTAAFAGRTALKTATHKMKNEVFMSDPRPVVTNIPAGLAILFPFYHGAPVSCQARHGKRTGAPSGPPESRRRTRRPTFTGAEKDLARTTCAIAIVNSDDVMQNGAMKERTLGTQGLRCSAIGLGCGGMSAAYGPRGRGN